MKVYFFDFKTKRYTGEGNALENPQNRSNPHIQGNATKVKPPLCKECEAPYYVRETNSWELKPCYIGKKAVHIASKMVETVYYEGELKEGWQYVTDETAEEIQSVPERYKVENNVLVRLEDDEYKKHLSELEAEKRKAEIKAELETLDNEAVRPLRAVTAGTGTDEDTAKLQEIEAKAETLRSEYRTLETIVQ